MNKADFLTLKHMVIDAGYGEEIIQSESLKPCDDAISFVLEYIWVVVSGGLRSQVARLIERRIIDAWSEGKPIESVFHHLGKVKAIDYVRRNRHRLFAEYQKAEDKINFLASLPQIGDVTKYHLAKNLGFDVAKPDRHLSRLAQKYQTTVQSLCRKLAGETGLRVSTVDLILWRACNLGLIEA